MATAQNVRRFQVKQREAGVPLPTMNAFVSTLRFFTHTVDQPDLARKLVKVSYPRKLPVVLSPTRRPGFSRPRPASSIRPLCRWPTEPAYAEVADLKASDIDSERTLTGRAQQGRQYRNAMLAADLLILLHEWWKAGRQ